MAQINMDEIKKTTVNSAEVKESEMSQPAEPNNEPAESTDNTSETAENTNEIKEDKAEETDKGNKAEGKVVVTYVGSGIWKDSEGKLWASEKRSDNILSERQYDAIVYNSREDIKFMVNYGAMKAINVK